jgi:hypothetical protein
MKVTEEKHFMSEKLVTPFLPDGETLLQKSGSF